MSKNTAKNREKLTCFFARPNSEVFARRVDGKPNISGYAAKFDRFSEDLGGYRTVIAKGAFDKVILSADCRFLINHDENLLMGRTSSGTLRLSIDADGLYFDGDPPDSDLSRHYMAAIERGDMDGCSFSCDVEEDRWDFSGDPPVRTLVMLGNLYDVGPVTYPAFRDTSVTVSHALEQARAAMMVKILRPQLGLGMMRLGIALAR